MAFLIVLGERPAKLSRLLESEILPSRLYRVHEGYSTVSRVGLPTVVHWPGAPPL
jgi:hypothetical protein